VSEYSLTPHPTQYRSFRRRKTSGDVTMTYMTENAGVEKSGADTTGGKCRSRQVDRMESRTDIAISYILETLKKVTSKNCLKISQ